MDTLPSRLDNRPPVKELLADRLSDIPDLLRDQGAELTARKDELLADAERFPDAVNDDDVAGRVTDLVKDIAACIKNAEAARVADKEPTMAAGRMVDGFYKPICDELTTAKRAAEAKLTAYQRKKAEAERAARMEAERKAAEEAEAARLAAERALDRAQDDTTLTAAVIAEDAAQQAEADAAKAAREAAAKAAELSRTRSVGGAVASLRTFWTFADLDRKALDLEPLRAHLPQAALETAVRSFIKAGGRKLKGVRIFEDTATVVR